MTDTENTAASLVPQIIEAHEAIATAYMKGHQSALEHAEPQGRIVTRIARRRTGAESAVSSAVAFCEPQSETH